MASSQLGSVAIQMPEMESRNGASPRELIRGFLEYEVLHQRIAKYPQLGIYEQFGEDRALCMSYVESKVHRNSRDVRDYMHDVNSGVMDTQTEEEVLADLDDKMIKLMESLHLHSRMFTECRNMSQSTLPSSLSMDLYRSHLEKAVGVTQAPNGQDKSVYGQTGTAVSSKHTALDNENLNPIESLLFQILVPFSEYIRDPLARLWRKMRGDQGDSASVPIRNIDSRHISALAKVVTCMLATLSLAVAISVLDVIPEPKDRIVVMTLFGLGFASSVPFFGQDSMPLYHLITAYFQAMVIFVGTSNNN